MPIYERKDIFGKIEIDGKVKCAECMNADDIILEDGEEFIFLHNPFDHDYIFICDYCNKTI
jgi:hypothetical protein